MSEDDDRTLPAPVCLYYVFAVGVECPLDFVAFEVSHARVELSINNLKVDYFKHYLLNLILEEAALLYSLNIIRIERVTC